MQRRFFSESEESDYPKKPVVPKQPKPKSHPPSSAVLKMKLGEICFANTKVVFVYHVYI